MKKRILSFFLVVLILFSLFSNSTVKATTDEEYSIIYEKIEHYFDIKYNEYHYFTYWLRGNFYYCYIENIDLSTPIYIVKDEDNNLHVYDVNTQEELSYLIKAVEFLKISYTDYSDSVKILPTDFITFNYSSYNDPVHSNFTMYNSDNTIFFQQTPSVVRPVVERVALKEVIKEVLGILPLIIALLVCFLGFRKGLQVLSNVLHKA